MTQQIRVYAADHDGNAGVETFTDMAEAFKRFDEERAKPAAFTVSIEVLKLKPESIPGRIVSDFTETEWDALTDSQKAAYRSNPDEFVKQYRCKCPGPGTVLDEVASDIPPGPAYSPRPVGHNPVG